MICDMIEVTQDLPKNVETADIDVCNSNTSSAVSTFDKQIRLNIDSNLQTWYSYRFAFSDKIVYYPKHK